MLEATKSYRHSSQNISKFINGLSDDREKKIFSLYLDLFEGNYRRLKELGDSLAKLKDQYYNSHHTFLGNISLNELYKIRKIAFEQYQFYFKKHCCSKAFLIWAKYLSIILRRLYAQTETLLILLPERLVLHQRNTDTVSMQSTLIF